MAKTKTIGTTWKGIQLPMDTSKRYCSRQVSDIGGYIRRTDIALKYDDRKDGEHTRFEALWLKFVDTVNTGTSVHKSLVSAVFPRSGVPSTIDTAELLPLPQPYRNFYVDNGEALINESRHATKEDRSQKYKTDEGISFSTSSLCYYKPTPALCHKNSHHYRQQSQPTKWWANLYCSVHIIEINDMTMATSGQHKEQASCNSPKEVLLSHAAWLFQILLFILGFPWNLFSFRAIEHGTSTSQWKRELTYHGVSILLIKISKLYKLEGKEEAHLLEVKWHERLGTLRTLVWRKHLKVEVKSWYYIVDTCYSIPSYSIPLISLSGP